LPLPLPQPMLPAGESIAHRTRARAPAPRPLALFTSGRPLHESFTYQMPTAKTTRSKGELIGFSGLCSSMPATEVPRFAGLCQALSFLDMPDALSVLDPSTGEFLEHRQLQRDPRYKKHGTLPTPTSWEDCAKELVQEPPSTPNGLQALTHSFSLIIMTSHSTNEWKSATPW